MVQHWPGSDLMVLHRRCIANGIESPMNVYSSSYPTIKGKKHIDFCQLFDQRWVKATFDNKYRSVKLDDVARSLLGKGKLEGQHQLTQILHRLDILSTVYPAVRNIIPSVATTLKILRQYNHTSTYLPPLLCICYCGRNYSVQL